MNSIIELHDSTVSEIIQRDLTVIVHFLPAYLHKSDGRPGLDPGTGWIQEGRLCFAEASLSGALPDFPCDVIDGELVLGSVRHANKIPIPLESAEQVELRLNFDTMHTVTITGRGLRLELLSVPRYVEEFNLPNFGSSMPRT